MAEFTIRFAVRLGVIAGSLMADVEIPTVTFCDLARNPTAYFDKPVRLDAVFEQHTEGQYLSHESCPLSHDDQIGVGYAKENDEAHAESVRQTRAKIQLPEFRGRAEVTIVGVLRNTSARHFYWYGTLFEIASVERARSAVALYDGNLEEGRTYRAKATRDGHGELVIAPRLRIPFHHAGRIEWTGAQAVATSPLSSKHWIAEAVFRVVSKSVVAAGPGSWRMTFHCDLLRFE